MDLVPDRTACVVVGGPRRTYAELEARVNRLAHHLRSAGVEPGNHVGIYAYNGIEWIESMMALYKIRAVPVNINYRYVESEFEYLCANADLVAVVAQQEFAPRLAAIRDHLPKLAHVVIAADGSGASTDGLEFTDYEEAVASGSPARDFGPRSGDDLHIIYTGGTTGMPKGVMWRQEDIFYALCGGIDAYSNEKLAHPGVLAEKVAAGGGPMVNFPIAPMMHGAGQVTMIRSLIHGDTGRRHAEVRRGGRPGGSSRPRRSTCSASPATPWPGHSPTRWRTSPTMWICRRCSRSVRVPRSSASPSRTS